MEDEDMELNIDEDDLDNPEWIDVHEKSFVEDLNKLTRHLCVYTMCFL